MSFICDPGFNCCAFVIANFIESSSADGTDAELVMGLDLVSCFMDV